MLRESRKINIKIFALVLGLAVFGLIMQYSASSYNAMRDYGDSFYYVKKQGIALIAGLVIMLLLTSVNTDIYDKYAYLIYGIGAALLALLFIPGVGVEKYGATRWLNLGFTTFQPSEYAKFALMILIAHFLKKESSKTLKGMLPIFLFTLITAGLIIVEPNMSITMLVCLSVMVMLFVGGTKLRHFALLAAPLVFAVILLIIIEPYRMKRILAFIDPWSSPQDEGFQLIQSYYALSGGGLFGVGLFNSRQKYAFLPFSESDFIFSIVGEELGLFGCMVLMGAFFALVYYGVKTAKNASTPFKSYLAAGITAVIALQTVLNTAVVTGTIPPTGLPLPFISAGGSSLVVFMAAAGILIRINKESCLERAALFDTRERKLKPFKNRG